jgi:hypothetical protein
MSAVDFSAQSRCNPCGQRLRTPRMTRDARRQGGADPRPWVHGSKLALRRGEVLEALGISEETFDRHVRPHLPVVRLGTVRLYPIDGLDRFLARRASDPANDLLGEVA